MGKASTSKKVARAASTGGGRTARGNTPVTWYLTLFVVIALGLGLVAVSRRQRVNELAGSGSKVAPTLADHWHVAYGVYVCDRWLGPVTDQVDPKGVHTHGDGIVHVHPQARSASGTNAVVARFTEAFGGSVAATKVTWFEGAKKLTKSNGEKCGSDPSEWKFAMNGKEVKSNPAGIRFTDKGKLVLAFVPKSKAIVGEAGLGDPPSTATLSNLSDVAPTSAAATPPGITVGDPTAITVPVGDATTVGAGGAPTTAAPATPSTAKP